MMRPNIQSLTLVAISEDELPKFNKIGDTYVLYKTIFSDDIQIGFMDNYLSYFAPSLANTKYLNFAESKAYFYDPDSSYQKIDIEEDRPVYEVVSSGDKTIIGYSIINGHTPLEMVLYNTNSIEKVSPDNKYFVK